ncbi:hypothetical protein ABZX62_08770 [Streptomyces flavidovirens]|uniref:hypothetical protein n=1 Tax=Streptomyces flavidovirens TaxID=67298 RepID=UPI0033A03CFD
MVPASLRRKKEGSGSLVGQISYLPWSVIGRVGLRNDGLLEFFEDGMAVGRLSPPYSSAFAGTGPVVRW